ncbi:MAG: DHH family phosphoesterase [Methanomassiliicoccales archaeon]|nr:DHH family phosphoesterase [Methanomassiliicoccales archaeon]
MTPPKISDLQGFTNAAKDIAEILLGATRVSIIAHIDADGICGASIASTALEREGIEHSVRFVKRLDEMEIARINGDPADVVWLVDMGSGVYSKISHPCACVTDHHLPEPSAGQRMAKGRISLLSFLQKHLNPHLFGIDGSLHISGAGTTYMVAREMAEKNKDLAPLAIVGAVGDLQDSAECRLTGINTLILEEAREQKKMTAIRDIRIFGRETRPISKMLQYSTDPILPQLTNDAVSCERFLAHLDIPLVEGEVWRSWVDLTFEEKRKIASALCHHLLDSGSGHWAVKRLIGDVYIIEDERPKTALHDAKEFSTLLNACGRYGEGHIGMRICKGDRGEALQSGMRLLQNHRGNLADAIALVKEVGVIKGRAVQYFHGRDEILDSIVGIVAGMVLGSGEVSIDIPIVAFAYSEENKVKVSARATRELVRKGLDLAEAVKRASERVGGIGGGHNIAAGATIDSGKEMQFIEEIERIIEEQLSTRFTE